MLNEWEFLYFFYFFLGTFCKFLFEAVLSTKDFSPASYLFPSHNIYVLFMRPCVRTDTKELD